MNRSPILPFLLFILFVYGKAIAKNTPCVKSPANFWNCDTKLPDPPKREVVVVQPASADYCPTCNLDGIRAAPLNVPAFTNVKDSNKAVAVTLDPAEISITACKLTTYPDSSITLSYVLKKGVKGSSFLLTIRGELSNPLYPESTKKTSRLLFNKAIAVTSNQAVSETIKIDKNHDLFKAWRKCDVRPPPECIATQAQDATNSTSDCYKKFWGDEAASTKNCPLEIKGTKLSGIVESIPDTTGVKLPLKTIHTSITKPENNFIAIYCGGSGASGTYSPPVTKTPVKKEEVTVPEPEKEDADDYIYSAPPKSNVNYIPAATMPTQTQPMQLAPVVLPPPSSMTIDQNQGVR